ncbi:hypothetical protein, partial [Vibrio aestuarianus]|uniref:hypothetical protein n=1 Tax=Vibrio aestuarianus TaxID=28171 RepID=UPI001B348898
MSGIFTLVPNLALRNFVPLPEPRPLSKIKKILDKTRVFSSILKYAVRQNYKDASAPQFLSTLFFVPTEKNNNIIPTPRKQIND